MRLPDWWWLRPGAFRTIVVAQAMSAAGDALVAISLAGTLFFSAPTSQARGKILLGLLLTMTPYAVLSPVIGPALDRWRGAYRLAIIVAAAGRAVLCLFMATRTQSLELYPMTFGVLVLSRAHTVSRAALIPELTPEDHTLVEANARIAVVSVAAGTVAGLPGAGIQSWLHSGATLRLAAIVFLAAAIVDVRLPRTKVRARAAVERVKGKISKLLSRPLLAGGTAMAASRGAVGFLVFMLAFVLRARSVGAKGFGAVLAAAGAGTFIGALIAPLLRKVWRESTMMLAALALMAIVAFIVAPHFSLWNAVLVSLVFSIGTATARLGFDSFVQHDAPEEVRARTFARYETIFQLWWVVGAAIGVAIPFGFGAGLRTAAVICLAGGVMSIVSERREP